MAPRQQSTVGRKGRIQWGRINKIMALVPPQYAPSSDSSSEEEDEIIPTCPQNNADPGNLSDASSEARSIPSSLERLNLLNSDDETEHLPVLSDDETEPAAAALLSDEETVPLTPVIQEIFPASPQVPLPALNLTSILSPYTPSPAAQTRSKRKATQQPPRAVRKKKFARKTLTYTWKATKFDHNAILDEADFVLPTDSQLKAPSDFFLSFFSEDIMLMIRDQTNLFSVQSNEASKCINVTIDDIRDFIAVTIIMGVVPMPSYRDYWSKDLRFAPIADVMSLKKYESLRRYLHFVDNSLINDDRYFKIRPLLEAVRQNCLKLDEEKRYSVDEMMVPYKGTRAGSRRQYLPKKPKKWGFKIFVRAGVSGLVYDFLPYGGDDTFRFCSFTDYEDSLGLGAKVVIALCKNIKTKPSVVYFDNFFTSLELIRLLRHEHGIFSLGTIRNNRLRGCQEKLPTDKQLSKKDRGTSKQLVCKKNKLAVVKWLDNKVVTLASSFVDSHPMETIRRYSKVEKSRVNVDCPQIVKQYNAHMGGVDLADMLVALYRSNFKTKRWYMAIFSQVLDICVNNGWLLYRRQAGATEKTMPLKKFRLQLAMELLKKNRAGPANAIVPVRKGTVVPRPPPVVQYDNTGHLPVYTSYGRCRHCKKGNTNMECSKCKLRLCLVAKRNCFYSFHVAQ